MPLAKYEAVVVALAFVVPGFVFSSTRSMLTPRAARSAQAQVLGFLASSSVVWAIWFWPVVHLAERVRGGTFAVWAAMGVRAFLVFVTPAALALVVGWADRKEVARGLLVKLGYSPSDPSPSAWAYKFHRLQKGAWLAVTLKDGTQVLGKYANRSAVGTEKGNHDLYLEEVWEVGDGDPKPPGEQDDGILFAADEIRYVEFTRAYAKGDSLGDEDGTPPKTRNGHPPDEAPGAGEHPAQRTPDATDRDGPAEELAASGPAEPDGHPPN